MGCTHVFPCSALRQLIYENDEKKLVLEHLTGEIDPAASDYTVGKVKVEVLFATSRDTSTAEVIGDPTDSARKKGSRKMGQISKR